MARPDPTIDLTDAEKCDLIGLIQGLIDIFGNDTMTIVPVQPG